MFCVVVLSSFEKQLAIKKNVICQFDKNNSYYSDFKILDFFKIILLIFGQKPNESTNSLCDIAVVVSAGERGRQVPSAAPGPAQVRGHHTTLLSSSLLCHTVFLFW